MPVGLQLLRYLLRNNPRALQRLNNICLGAVLGAGLTFIIALIFNPAEEWFAGIFWIMVFISITGVFVFKRKRT